MPTGYTASIYEEEVSLRDFALRCARNFGALIHMREDSLDLEIRKRIPEDRTEDLKRVSETLEEFKKMSDAECEAEALKEYKEAVAETQRRIQRHQERKQRYLKMLDEVKQWIPPTPDHDGLKEFMIQQIRESIGFDCYEIEYRPILRTGREWKELMIKDALEELQKIAKDQEEEAKRCSEANEWIRQLQESL